MSEHAVLDVVVVGSGAAGLRVALEATALGRAVTIVTKAGLGDSTSELAQGGIAAVLAESDEDTTAAHLADTLRAGVGLCDGEAAALLVESADDAVDELVRIGARFDRDGAGNLALSREGGHSRARVVHAGGAATGAELIATLRAAVSSAPIDVLADCAVLELVVESGRCVGVRVLDASGAVQTLRANAVVLATGGVGQCFAITTNPLGATGDGVALALRAGVAVADLEFVQFHPTALVTASVPRPLLTEALRGEGALLRDASGARFVDELAPRDVVSRAIAEQCARDGVDHVLLDARPIDDFARRFPSIAAILAGAGLDARRDLLPVAPAAHYVSGGVLTDLDGASSLPGLFAVGEVACTGVHGANRLASNSLLEGLVFARRAARAIAAGNDRAAQTGALRTSTERAEDPDAPVPCVPIEVTLASPRLAERAGDAVREVRASLQQLMTEGAGVRRSAESLALAAKQLARLADEHLVAPRRAEENELASLLTVSVAIVEAATRREESRGAHTRLDYPGTDPRLRVRFSPVLVRGSARGDATSEAARR